MKTLISHKLYKEIDQEFPIHDELRDFANGIYLHGQLQSINGYDICSFVVGNRPEKPGIYPAKVWIDKCTAIYAILYYWVVSGLQRGLIVMKGDVEGNNEALEKFFAKDYNL